MRYSFHGGIPASVGTSFSAAVRSRSSFTPKNIIVSIGESYTPSVRTGDKVFEGSVLALSEDSSLMPDLSRHARGSEQRCLSLAEKTD